MEMWQDSFGKGALGALDNVKKGDPFLSEGNGGRACCLHIGCGVSHGTCGSPLCLSLDIASVPFMCSH